MKVRNNYNECLTNLACSIQKYFELDYKHASLKCIDEIIERKQPKNVIVILYDGMGDNTLLKTMDKDSFFVKNRIGRITSVFPATTTAATTSIESGLNPAEHGYLGWNTYIKNIDKVVTLFMDMEKGAEESTEEVVEAIEKYYAYKPIVQQINEAGKYEAHNVSKFGDIDYTDLDDMVNVLADLCNKPGKKYMYVYNNQPDSSMHKFGPDSPEAKTLIRERNDATEKLAGMVEDTVIITIADHGHVVVEDMLLEDHPDIYELLERQTSIEPRACALKVKESSHKLFEELFEKYYGQYFTLLTKQEVMDIKLFGDGEMHPNFEESLADYLAIAVDSNKCLMTKEDYPLYSQHAGYTDDELYVPLIVVEK